MSEQAPYVITISRQMGSGGGYIGQRVASRLGIQYADREIVRQAAQVFDVPVEAVEPVDEKMTPAWESVLRSFEQGRPEFCYLPSANLPPQDSEFHAAESTVIIHIAKNWSSVIVGRGGYYLLRNRPRHLAVFLYSDVNFRIKRVQEICKVSPKEAAKMIESSDYERKRYLFDTTGVDWADARQYHLSLDTGALGFPLVEEIIIDCLNAHIK